MRTYAHDEPDAEPLLEDVAMYTREAMAREFPYWVFAEDDTPIGVLVLGEEPVRLIAETGTPMALVYITNTDATEQLVSEFLGEALALAKTKGCQYVLATMQSYDEKRKESFLDAGFKEMDHAHRMVNELAADYNHSGSLRFKPVQRSEMRDYIRLATRCLQGSPDVMLATALEHMLEVSEEFLDVHHQNMKSFVALRDDLPIGVLDLNPDSGLIGTVGVAPDQRGRGYGRDITAYALQSLKESGCEHAYLRVHVDNDAAVLLYESMGFEVAGNYLSLIWRQSQQGSES